MIIRYSHAVLIVGFAFLSMNSRAQDGTPYMPDGYIPVLNNYIRTWDAKAPVTDPGTLTTRPVRDVLQTTNYFDGLGRSKQSVIKQGSLKPGTNEFQDLVTPVTYEYGREIRRYLPFASKEGNGFLKFDPFQEQETFYNDANPNSPVYLQGEKYFYSKTDFESLTGNVRKVYPVGNSWVHDGKGVKMNYWLNTLNDDVKIWYVNNVSGGFGTFSVGGAYQANELFKSITEDEHGKQVIEFKDKSGNIILKKVQLLDNANGVTVKDDGYGKGYDGWLCTYYIYDELNNLRCVIQPEGVKVLAANNWIIDYSPGKLADEQCFRYEYDQRSRMTRKKVPGAGEVYMVYDGRDRLVMVQDAKLRDAGKWLVTKYDNLNRPVETGRWNNNGTSFDTHLLNAYNNVTGYPTTTSDYELLTATHYDNYTGLPGVLSDYLSDWNSYFSATNNNSWPFPQMPQKSLAIKGLATWTKTRVLGSNDFLYSVSYYDDKGRVIQVQSTNITGGLDVVTTQYNWSGQALVIVQKQQVSTGTAQTTEVVTQMTYDDLGRVTKIEKKVGNSLVNNGAMPQDFTTIVQNDYDRLGQLKNKKLGANNLETLTYEYNIRGWLLGMNRDYLDETNPSGKAFGFELGYDKLTNKANRNFLAGSNGGEFNGNINGMIWKSKGDQVRRKYDFEYDAANRLLKGDFEQNDNGSNWGKSIVDYSMKMGDGINVNTAYDNNGNIKRMQQWGLKIGGSSQIDDLSYQYITGSNKLLSVTEPTLGTTDNKLGDFTDKNTTNDDYSYDVNGNMNADKNKAISDITYNHLNLPEVITVTGKGTITYTYDAAGNKVKKVTVDNTITPAKTTTTIYAGGLVYENDVLQFVSHEEGRIRFTAATGTTAAQFNYDYFIKDHLGNVRMVLTEEQKQDQYPAATLEGDLATSTDAVYVEKDFYDIKSDYIVNKSTVTGLTDYPNHNGNPPYNNNPNSNVTANSEKVYRLHAATNKTGLGITLKVMAGDQIDIYGKSYWFNSGGNYSDKFPVPVSSLIDAFVGTPTMVGKGVTAAGISTPGLIGDLAQFTNRTDNVNAPWAYINWIFFDEQFKYAGGGFDRVGGNGVRKDHQLGGSYLKAPKNGYVFVYCSNESQENVYFDNLQVFHNRGPLLEETHYYPFGLIQAGISSKALSFGGVENKKKFNGIEHTTDFDLNTYEAFFRSADPQIGRWWQIDPKPNMAESPYSMMGNNPILNADPLGDTLRGSSNQDARRLQRIIRQTFRGKEMKAVRQMFQRRLHAGDKQTFAGIAQWQVNQATAKLSADQRSLVEGYVDAINSTQVHTVEVARRGETLRDANSTMFGDRTGADVDASAGGGFNVATATGTHSVIVMNSTANIPDYRDNNTGALVPGMTSSRGELLAHELLGHGLTNFNPGGSQFLNAIQLTNLYHRVTGTGNLYRDGTSHGGTTGVPLTYSQASGVPTYLQQTNIHFLMQTLRTFLRILP